MQESLFTKIITGEIPCHKVYEDERTLAFLDIHPVSAGHTLVISKKQVEFIWDLEDEDYTALMATVRKIGLRLRDVVASPYVGQLVIGTDIPHAHVHVVPFHDPSQLQNALESAGELSVDHAELALLAEKLRFE
jgi:histidine triad (HIT) family protein